MTTTNKKSKQEDNLLEAIDQMIAENDEQYKRIQPNEMMLVHGAIRSENTTLKMVRKLIIADREQLKKDIVANCKFIPSKDGKRDELWIFSGDAFDVIDGIVTGKEEKGDSDKQK